MAFQLLPEWLWPGLGILGLVVLFLLRGLLAAGRWSQGYFQRQLHTLSVPSAADAQTIRRVHRAAHASLIWSSIALRLYYGVTLGSSLLLLTTQALPRENAEYLRLVLTLISFSGALMLLSYWQSWDDDRERAVHKQLREIYEKHLAKQGVPVRDPLTSAYTRAFFESELRREGNRLFQRPLPISIAILELEGFTVLRARQGDEVADSILAPIGRTLAQNVRSYDLVSRYDRDRFAIALLRCSLENAERASKRMVKNLNTLHLGEINRTHRAHLHFVWGSATLSRRGMPLQLLTAEAERKLSQRKELHRLGILSTERPSPKLAPKEVSP